jgi:exonuclease III
LLVTDFLDEASSIRSNAASCILSWNIENLEPGALAEHLARFGDLDVVCLQEIRLRSQIAISSRSCPHCFRASLVPRRCATTRVRDTAILDDRAARKRSDHAPLVLDIE